MPRCLPFADPSFEEQSVSNQEAIAEIRNVINSLKTEDGKSIVETNVIHSVGVDPKTGVISIKLNLTKDYRKAKALLTQTLKEQIPWASKVKVEMAPRE